MKFCKPKVYEYSGINGVLTTTKYVTFNDVKAFHGEDFAQQWKTFITKSTTFKLMNEECFYYIDYKHFAVATDMYINSA